MTFIDPNKAAPVSGRRVFLGAAAAAIAATAAGQSGQAADTKTGGGPLSDIPIVLPQTEFVYEAIFTLQDMIEMGASPQGDRRIINITGGEFAGPRIKGKVMPGGADRQVLRKDGVRLLNALYELQADDGAIITVNNRVLIDRQPDGTQYAFSHIDITAPDGPHDWLNRRVFVGTLHSLRPKPMVLIRVFSLV
ncbi:DUF3237 domain-containing protein [Agrobacterium vitis]|uniref:UPF0311 protein IEI95_026395 n=1 Tax=Agrobacterium vitis TaxID=373 RepID=A0AAE2RJ27_AGRVI|nr:DUF3237 domain-containing protein [Agrobacterium vitis]MBF2717735.1 DUF3237 domain-containing protein [Agrobacterium vitis]MUZ61627.1 DUF3237 family protein [Agrobacterium vitis]MVA21615.1 DUF3237 family protein [Agrobacterium vitis]